MQTIVFFSNDGIQVLQGTIKGGHLGITNFKTLAIEEGALINGVITNDEAVKHAISEAVKEDSNLFKNLKLIIDSSLIATKNVEVPDLKPKELDAVAVTEFEDTAGNYDDLVVDYARIPGLNGSNLFCCGLEKRVVESYVTLFESLKIKVMSIDVGLNAIIQYVSETKDYQRKTLALNILDGKNLVSILFENGIYIFSNRSRLLAERGTDAFAEELSEKLSSLTQFYQSQKSDYPLEMGFYAGMDEYELNGLKALNFDPELYLFTLPQTPNITNGFVMDERFDFGRFIYPIAGFFTGRKPVNLLEAYKKSTIVKKTISLEFKALIIPAGMIAFCLLIFMTFVTLQFLNEKKLESLNAYISDPNNQIGYMQATALTKEIDAIQTETANLKIISNAINSNPNLTSDKFSHMETLGNGVIALSALDYDGTTGAIHITAVANNQREAAQYIERLIATQYFTQVEYTGYAQITATASGTNSSTSLGYGFVVDAYLKAGDTP